MARIENGFRKNYYSKPRHWKKVKYKSKMRVWGNENCIIDNSKEKQFKLKGLIRIIRKR